MKIENLTREDEEHYSEVWKKCLAELPPDERERILDNKTGPEAMSFAVTVAVRAGLFDNERNN